MHRRTVVDTHNNQLNSQTRDARASQEHIGARTNFRRLAPAIPPRQTDQPLRSTTSQRPGVQISASLRKTAKNTTTNLQQHLYNFHSAPVRQVQPPPAQASTPLPRTQPCPTDTRTVSTPILSFLDATFREYAGRIQTELASLRTACSRALFREQQDNEILKRQFIAVKLERDVAQERVRALVRDREARLTFPQGQIIGDIGPVKGKKRARDDDAPVQRNLEPNAVTCDRNLHVSQPSSPFISVSPIPSTSSLSPTRELSPVTDPHTVRRPRSPHVSNPVANTNEEDDLTSYEITILGDCTRLSAEPASKKRRTSNVSVSSEVSVVTLVNDTSTSMVKRESVSPVLCFPQEESGECDMDLESEDDSRENVERRAASLTPPSSSPPLPPSSAWKSGSLGLVHADLMYLPTKNNLVCRACTLPSQSNSQSTDTRKPQAACKFFPTNARWEDLRDHYLKEHQSACADVVRLNPAELFELRRRLRYYDQTRS